MASPQHIATSLPASTVFDGGIETDKARPTDDSISASAGKVNDLRDIFPGNGSPEDPFRVDYLPNDPQDAIAFSTTKKWLITTHQAVATLAVTFASSAYSGAVKISSSTLKYPMKSQPWECLYTSLVLRLDPFFGRLFRSSMGGNKYWSSH